MKKVIIIPARLSSSRLTNKVLLDLNGKTILQRVFEKCIKVKDAVVYIATDSKRIQDSCLNYTTNVIMTSVRHKSGTERVIEALKNLKYDFAVNVQADEPFINPLLIEKIFERLTQKNIQVVTACTRLFNKEELFDSNIVKLVKDINNNALYFSRSCIPHIHKEKQILLDQKNFFSDVFFFKHIGVYGFKRNFIKNYSLLKKSILENVEMLEQLRILESGFKINVVETKFKSIGIDTVEDYIKAKEMMEFSFNK